MALLTPVRIIGTEYCFDVHLSLPAVEVLSDKPDLYHKGVISALRLFEQGSVMFKDLNGVIADKLEDIALKYTLNTE